MESDIKCSEINTVKPVLRDHSWKRDNVVF